jgi:hypothetical protein
MVYSDGIIFPMWGRDASVISSISIVVVFAVHVAAWVALIYNKALLRSPWRMLAGNEMPFSMTGTIVFTMFLRGASSLSGLAYAAPRLRELAVG